MKKIITLLLAILTTNLSISQKNNFSELGLEQSIFDVFVNYANETKDTVFNIKRSDVVDKSCFHHNRFLGNIPNEPDKFLICHHESKKIGKYDYVGSDTILKHYFDRLSFYDTKKEYIPLSEILFLGTNANNRLFENPNTTNIIIAKHVLKNFLDSKEHKEIIHMFNYDYIGVDVMFHKNFYTVVIMFADDNIIGNNIIK